MLTKIGTRSVLVIICLAVAVTMPASHAMVDVRVTVTFAAGGAACGFYLFFYLTSGYTLQRSYCLKEEPMALLNVRNNSWYIGPPALHYMERGNAVHMPYINLMQFYF